MYISFNCTGTKNILREKLVSYSGIRQRIDIQN
ncbi:Protein of unknown function [Bacillus mobilis]|nr:Protein of unknown function [Bacillus mobilis]